MRLPLILPVFLFTEPKEVLQRVCCAFKACCARFKELVPAGFYAKVESEIMATFLTQIALSNS